MHCLPSLLSSGTNKNDNPFYHRYEATPTVLALQPFYPLGPIEMIIHFTIVMKLHQLYWPYNPSILWNPYNDNSFHHRYEATPTVLVFHPFYPLGPWSSLHSILWDLYNDN